MYYSKRQLYALGEPLGESVTQRKAGGGMIYGGGGGSSAPAASSAPTNTTVTNTNIPDYAQPYVMNMLQAAQSQIFQPDLTTFNAYKPYSNNPQDYVAGFSPLQQQAQSSAANLQMPGQYKAATGMTGQAAMGTLGNAMQESQTGQNFQNMATNPNAVGAYMNPYLQQSLAPQLQLANQQYGIAGQQQQGAATQSNAFGGSREALMSGLNQQNQMLAQNQLISQGYNQAFNNAQQQMNTGAQLGLQGQQAAQAGMAQYGALGNQMANIGGQELSAQQGIIGTQSTQGAQEQTQQQNVINQAVQNYATAQQYPYMQLGTMNAMLRGLPMQQTTTSSYQAQPTAVQSGIGLLGAGTALAGAYTGKKEGGVIGMKSGGEVPGFKYGTLINDAQLQNDAAHLSSGQLEGRIKDPVVNQDERAMFQGMQADQNRLRQNPSAGPAIAQAGLPQQPQPGMAPPPQNPQQMPMDARLSGIAQGGGGAFQGMASPTRRLAGGGILAFAGDGEEGSEVKETPAPGSKEAYLAEQSNYFKSRGIEPGVGAKSKAAMSALEEQQAANPDRADFQKRLAIAQGFLDFAQTPATGSGLAGLLKPAAHAVGVGATGYGAAVEAGDKAKLANIQSQAALEDSNRKAAEGDWAGATKSYEESEKIKKDIAVEAMKVKGALAAASIPYADKRASKEAIRAELKTALGRDPTESEILSKYTEATTTAGETADTRARIAANTEYQKWEKGLFLAPEYADLIAAANKGDKDALAKLAQVKEAKYKEILDRVKPTAAAAPTAPVAQPNTYDKGSVVKYDGKEYKFKGGDQYDRKNWEAV